MAKLVDAPGLGPDARKGVGVRVPFLAPLVLIAVHTNPARIRRAGFCVFRAPPRRSRRLAPNQSTRTKKPRAKAGLAHHIEDWRLLSGSAFPSDDALSP